MLLDPRERLHGHLDRLPRDARRLRPLPPVGTGEGFAMTTRTGTLGRRPARLESAAGADDGRAVEGRE